MSKFTVGQAVTVQHKRSGRTIPGIVSDVLLRLDSQGLPEQLRIGGQPQYTVEIGGTNMQCGEDQVSAR